MFLRSVALTKGREKRNRKEKKRRKERGKEDPCCSIYLH
jgi:hypothetical protein